MSQIINVRMEGEWIDEMYPFCPQMMNDLRGIFGDENVRLISEEEFERYRLRKQQDEEFAKEKQVDNAIQPNIQPNIQPTNQGEEAKSECDRTELSREELRKKRIAYFETRLQRDKWKKRLRPRKK